MVRWTVHGPLYRLWSVKPFMVRQTVYGPLERLWSVRSFMVRYIFYGPLDRLWSVIPLVPLTIGPFDRWAFKPEHTLYFYADPDPDLGFQIKAQNLEQVLKEAHIPYILACHLQIDADPDPAINLIRIPAHHFDPGSRILPSNLMRIRISNTVQEAK
jgi:hypothetical protein